METPIGNTQTKVTINTDDYRNRGLGDARSIWQQREDKAREQEQAVLAIVKRHCDAAREDKLNGKVVFEFRYKDGGIMSKEVAVHVQEKENGFPARYSAHSQM